MKLFAIALSMALVPCCIQAQTLPPAFSTCPSTGFQTVNSPTDFQTVNLATGSTTTVKTLDIYVNAIGFNQLDDRIYGLKLVNPIKLVCIGSDYNYQLITTTGDALASAVIGDVSPNGILWCMSNANVFTVDCNTASATFGKCTIIGAKPAINITDWSFPVSDNTKIYSVTTTGSLVYMSTATRAVTVVLPDNALPADSYGATYFDASGNFYAKSNSNGNIYKILNATGASPTVILFSVSSSSGQNDGARCSSAAPPVIADYGDAPDSYGTYVTSNGAGHILPTPNPANALVYLGAAVTIDNDGSPAANANTDADDGVASFTPISGGFGSQSIASYSVTVSVHNASASTANVAGWIDWNNNGVFDAGERASTTAAAGFIGNKILTWTAITLSAPAPASGTYARFRVSTDALPLPTGTVSNGEVEDYYIPFTSLLPVSLTGFTASKSTTAVHLVWQTVSEQNSKGFYIEKSADGITYQQVTFIPTQATGGISSQKLVYDYYDDQPLAGISYYRLKQVDINNKMLYSGVAKIDFSRAGNAISVYPNPAADHVTVAGLSGSETLQLFNSTGQFIRKEKSTGANTMLNIAALSPGVYQLIVTEKNGERTILKLIKQ